MDLWTQRRQERGRGLSWESNTDIYTQPCIRQIQQQEAAIQHRELSSVLWWLRGVGWGVGGRLQRERIYVYTRPIHYAVQQRLTQRKAIIVQFKKRKERHGVKSSLSCVVWNLVGGPEIFFFHIQSCCNLCCVPRCKWRFSHGGLSYGPAILVQRRPWPLTVRIWKSILPLHPE